MPLNLTDLFTAIGRVGRNAYIVNGSQAIQKTPFNQLELVSGMNQAWIATLTQSYDQLIRTEMTGMSLWSQSAANVLMGLVSAQSPTYGASLPAALQYVLQEMLSQSKTVQECTIGSTVTADSGNVGTGTCAVTLVRGDGLILQNTIAETSTLLISADSYTGGRPVNRESWQWAGAPNVSSLKTGTPVGLWDWDWPQGSGAGASGAAVAASQDASTGTSNNYLTNGDFEDWDTTGTPFLNYWYKAVGTWGTSLQRSGATDGIDGGYCLQLNAGATLNALTQQFNSSTSDGTNAAAGTTARIQAYTGYMFNVWLKATGVISAGVLTVSLVDDTGTVINDEQGTANSQTITLSSVTTSWGAHTIAFRLPVDTPSVVRLKLAITTVLAGANLLIDWATFTLPVNCYPGGPNVAVFSNPASPFVAEPDPDGFTLTFTNNRGGASYGATFQTLFNRLFQTPSLILPYASVPNLADTLITSA